MQDIVDAANRKRLAQADFFEGTLDGDLLDPQTKRAIVREAKAHEQALLKQVAATARKVAKAQRKAEERLLLETQSAKCEQLFKLWQEQFDKGGCSLTDERRRLTSKMLARYGYDVCVQVLLIAAADENTRGKNRLNRPFDDLVNIFRNEERVDMYISMGKLTNAKAAHLIPHTEGVGRSERL